MGKQLFEEVYGIADRAFAPFRLRHPHKVYRESSSLLYSETHERAASVKTAEFTLLRNIQRKRAMDQLCDVDRPARFLHFASQRKHFGSSSKGLWPSLKRSPTVYICTRATSAALDSNIRLAASAQRARPGPAPRVDVCLIAVENDSSSFNHGRRNQSIASFPFYIL